MVFTRWGVCASPPPPPPAPSQDGEFLKLLFGGASRRGRCTHFSTALCRFRGGSLHEVYRAARGLNAGAQGWVVVFASYFSSADVSMSCAQLTITIARC
jgi:hypothetical protein